MQVEHYSHSQIIALHLHGVTTIVPRDVSVSDQLGFLRTADRLIIDSEIKVLDAMAGFNFPNKYIIRLPSGEGVLQCTERRSGLKWYSRSNYILELRDISGRIVIEMYRQRKCCKDTMYVFCPPGTCIGYIKKRMCGGHPVFYITDADGLQFLRVSGERFWRVTTLFLVVETQHMALVGSIQKNWTGMPPQKKDDVSNLAIKFPADLSIAAKALILGACLLIDYKYFNKKKKQSQSVGKSSKFDITDIKTLQSKQKFDRWSEDEFDFPVLAKD